MSDDFSTDHTISPAWSMEIKQRTIRKKLIFHPDRASQYVVGDSANIIKSCDGIVKQSIGSKGNFWNNAEVEISFKSLKLESTCKRCYGYKSEANFPSFNGLSPCTTEERCTSLRGIEQ